MGRRQSKTYHRIDQLDTVIWGRIVARRDHDTYVLTIELF